MWTRIFAAALLALSPAIVNASAIRPTTTLQEQTRNNTSAADTFAATTNGNAAAGDISKLPIHSLLYPGATTKIYTHLMPWFGTSSHISVGYDSSTAAQTQKQVADMVSRGIDGAIVDWYGRLKAHHNTATINTLKAAELYPGFEFAICEDIGAVNSTSDWTQSTILDLRYAYDTFMQSPAYMRVGGRPVIFFFGFEGQPVDLAAVKAALADFNPLFVFRNSGGFTKAQSDGSFSWVAPQTSGYDNYFGIDYLDNFYSTALKYPTAVNVGSAYKGFNDTLASWAPPGGRHVQQYCGQTWLKTFNEVGRYYAAGHQLPALQIVTWNDYEEGTAIESGIDNCVSLSTWMTGTTLNWAITGDESTVDHYEAFISADGANLMPLGSVATGTIGPGLGALDLAPFSFDAGTYQVFVKAVGKASMTNHMSSSLSVTIAGAGTPSTTPTPDFVVSVGSPAVTLTQGQPATTSIAVNSVNGVYASSVNFTCANLPANMACTFSPSTLTPGAAGAATMLTISTTSATSASLSRVGWALMPAFGVMVLGVTRRRVLRVLLVAVLTSAVMAAVGCGSAKIASSPVASPSTATGIYTISIVASSGAAVHTTTATVTVR